MTSHSPVDVLPLSMNGLIITFTASQQKDLTPWLVLWVTVKNIYMLNIRLDINCVMHLTAKLISLPKLIVMYHDVDKLTI